MGELWTFVRLDCDPLAAAAAGDPRASEHKPAEVCSRQLWHQAASREPLRQELGNGRQI